MKMAKAKAENFEKVLSIGTNYFRLIGGSPGLVVKGRDSRSEGRGFESRHCILDGHFFHIYL